MNRLRSFSMLAAVLLLTNSLTCFTVGATELSPESNTDTTEKTTFPEKTNTDIPDIIEAEEITTYGYISRDKEAETDLNTLVFKNKDGTNTMRMFSHPVKYVDEKGTVEDITLDITRSSSGDLVSAQHPVKTTFAKTLSEGISLSYDDVDVRMVPQTIKNENKESLAILSKDTNTVTYIADGSTSYVYALTYAGFKEDIVVDEYTGQTDYDFTLYTDGLTLEENDGSYYLTDEKGAVKASIGDIIIFTADEKNNQKGSMSFKTVRENQEYALTVHVDEDYLRDERTVYPIRIDPTLEISYANNGAGAIQDVTINENGYADTTSGSLYVGKRSSYGKSRILMRFPTLMSFLNGNNISSDLNVIEAYVEMRDLLCETQAMTVYCHLFEGNTWSESDTLTWNSVNADKVSMELSGRVVSYANGSVLDNPHRYNFDITKAVKAWSNGSFPIAKGIVFKATSVETYGNLIHKTFASYNRASYKPSVTLKYTNAVVRNEFYSRYNPTEYNYMGTYNAGDLTNHFQYKCNCYGYALSHVVDDQVILGWDNVNDKPVGYKQQPGDFNQYFHNLLTTDPTTLMDNVEAAIKDDAAKLGYTVTNYSLQSSKVDQFGEDSRLIAVVTGKPSNMYNGYLDYHFYIQHNDGIWSHKPGSDKVSKYGLDSNSTILTNDNIYQLANEGSYKYSGLLRFYKITKSAIPQTHTKYLLSYSTPISPVNAGNYMETAMTISAGTTNARCDYGLDHDYYYFTATKSNYQFYISCSGTNSFNCNIYNVNGSSLNSFAGIENTSFSVSLNPGSQYFIQVTNTSQTYVGYSLTIT